MMKREMTTAMRVASANEGNGDGVEGGKQATARRVMVTATTVVGKDESGGNCNEGGRQ
jgi:hypothetical protein